VKRTPRPVASRRPSEPPSATGLPVTTAVTVWRAVHRVRVHDPAIVCSFVFMSGAGTSLSGPMKSMSSAVYLRVRRSSSPDRHLLRVADDSRPCRRRTERLLPAHFQVIHADKRLHFVERARPEHIGIPPFAGPRAKLC
jgi:hypothetical protein